MSDDVIYLIYNKRDLRLHSWCEHGQISENMLNHDPNKIGPEF